MYMFGYLHTVKDLIKELETLPQDLIVYDFSYMPIEGVVVKEITVDEHEETKATVCMII